MKTMNTNRITTGAVRPLIAAATALFGGVATTYAGCYVVVAFLCHVGTGPFTCTKNCQVNCLCPKDAVINGLCYKTYSATCVDNDSSAHSLSCDNATGDGTDKCDPFTISDGCIYTSEELVCPSALPFPLVCVTTISPVNKTCDKQGVVTGYGCTGG